jgi:excisionase family DNA binding protein
MGMTTQDNSFTGQTLLTKAEAARRANVGQRTINNWMARGILPYIKLGSRAVRFLPKDVEKFILDRRVG